MGNLGSQENDALPEDHVGDVELLESRHPKSPRCGTRHIPQFRQGHPTAGGGDSEGRTSLPHRRDQSEPAGGEETMREERGRGGGKELVSQGKGETATVAIASGSDLSAPQSEH